MRQIITTARFEAHIETVSFALFTEELREEAILDSFDVPHCECCGRISERTREREVRFVTSDRYGDYEDSLGYELCPDCYVLSDAKVRLGACELQRQYGRDLELRSKEIKQRFLDLRAKHPSADWSKIAQTLYERGCGWAAWW